MEKSSTNRFPFYQQLEHETVPAALVLWQTTAKSHAWSLSIAVYAISYCRLSTLIPSRSSSQGLNVTSRFCCVGSCLPRCLAQLDLCPWRNSSICVKMPLFALLFVAIEDDTLRELGTQKLGNELRLALRHHFCFGADEKVCDMFCDMCIFHNCLHFFIKAGAYI